MFPRTLECYALYTICNKRELLCTASLVNLSKVQIKKLWSTLLEEAASLQYILLQRKVCTLCSAYSMCSVVFCCWCAGEVFYYCVLVWCSTTVHWWLTSSRTPCQYTSTPLVKCTAVLERQLFPYRAHYLVCWWGVLLLCTCEVFYYWCTGVPTEPTGEVYWCTGEGSCAPTEPTIWQ